MHYAIALLISATQLLTLVATNPNLPQSFRDNAVQTANFAISTAKAEIAKTPTTEIAVTPVILGQSPAMTTEAPAETPITREVIITPYAQTPVDALNGLPFGSHMFKVALVVNGTHVKGAQITMSSDTKTETKETNGQSEINSGDWTASFEYIPTSDGPHTITFTADGVSGSATI